VAWKEGRCAEKASAGKEAHPEIPPCFRRVGRAIGRPVDKTRLRAGRPYNGLTLFLAEEKLARPVQEMRRASWFLRATPFLSGRAMPEIQ